MLHMQDILALGIVALIVGWYLYRRSQKKASGCADCAESAPPSKEATVRFYRRAEPGPPDKADEPEHDGR